MSLKPMIVWFRHDLRLTDHPALTRAVESGRPVLPVYVLDDVSPGRWAMGAASRWWLHHSLTSLSAEIASRGGRRLLLRGAARQVIPALAAKVGAEAVHVSRMYEPWAAQQTFRKVSSRFSAKSLLKQGGLSRHSLAEPRMSA